MATGAVVALTVGAIPAEAQTKPKPIGGGKLITETATATPVAEGQIASATAACPGKTKAVAGGWATTPPVAGLPTPVGGHYLNVYESQMIGSGQWRVSAVQSTGNLDSLTVYVYCQKRKKPLASESSTVLLPTAVNTAAEGEVACDGGKVLSGGFLTEPPTSTNATVVTASHRISKSAWASAASREAGIEARTLTTYAYCAKASKIKQRTATVPVVGPLGASHKATPKRCQKKSKPRAGGFAVPHLATGLANSAVVHETRLVGNRWIAAASATGNNTNATVTSFQYCRT